MRWENPHPLRLERTYQQRIRRCIGTLVKSSRVVTLVSGTPKLGSRWGRATTVISLAKCTLQLYRHVAGFLAGVQNTVCSEQGRVSTKEGIGPHDVEYHSDPGQALLKLPSDVRLFSSQVQ